MVGTRTSLGEQQKHTDLLETQSKRTRGRARTRTRARARTGALSRARALWVRGRTIVEGAGVAKETVADDTKWVDRVADRVRVLGLPMWTRTVRQTPEFSIEMHKNTDCTHIEHRKNRGSAHLGAIF
eukprot:SAG11_NODE_6847_length_1237_cov_0.957821_1_plen_127_part_00